MNITTIVIIIAIVMTVMIGIASIKIKYDIVQNTEVVRKNEVSESNPKYLLNQIKNRLNLIIFIMILPTLIQIGLVLYFLNEINDITNPIRGFNFSQIILSIF